MGLKATISFGLFVTFSAANADEVQLIKGRLTHVGDYTTQTIGATKQHY